MTPTTVYDESPATEYEQPLLYLFYDYFTPHVPVIFFYTLIKSYIWIE